MIFSAISIPIEKLSFDIKMSLLTLRCGIIPHFFTVFTDNSSVHLKISLKR